MTTLTQSLVAHPCAHCGGAVSLVDHTGRERVFRGVPVRYPAGSVLPTCADCDALWLGEDLLALVYGSFRAQVAAT